MEAERLACEYVTVVTLLPSCRQTSKSPVCLFFIFPARYLLIQPRFSDLKVTQIKDYPS